MAVLLDDVNVDTTSAEYTAHGGEKIVVIRGDDFGGGTVNIELKSMNDTNSRWNLLNNGDFTANEEVRVNFLPVGVKIRAVFSGSSGASNVFVEIL